MKTMDKPKEFNWIQYSLEVVQKCLKKYTSKKEYYDDTSAYMDCIIAMDAEIQSLKGTIDGLREMIDWQEEVGEIR